MSFETSFDSKQPKLEPKLVLALSETKCLSRFFTAIPKQRVLMFRLNRNKQKTNQNSLTESIFWYFSENLGLKHENFSFCFHETQPKQIFFWFFRLEPEFYFRFEDTLVPTERFSSTIMKNSLPQHQDTADRGFSTCGRGGYKLFSYRTLFV